MLHRGTWALRGLTLLSLALLAGCAGVRREPSAQIYDPYEANNRITLRGNQALLGPIARVLSKTPGPVKDRLIDLNANLKEPRIFANDILQLRFNAAGKTLGRFVLNSTVGLGGLVDVAGRSGLPQQTGDFGQTLFVWGVNDGPYLVLPFFGPSSGRDAVGLAVDDLADPTGWALGEEFGTRATIGLAGLDFAAQVGQLKTAEDSSIDFYSFLRSSYYQTRRAQLREGLGLPPEAVPVDIAPAARPGTVVHARPGARP